MSKLPGFHAAGLEGGVGEEALHVDHDGGGLAAERAERVEGVGGDQLLVADGEDDGVVGAGADLLEQVDAVLMPDLLGVGVGVEGHRLGAVGLELLVDVDHAGVADVGARSP